jgi:hypothetical protein
MDGASDEESSGISEAKGGEPMPTGSDDSGGEYQRERQPIARVL